MDDILCHVPTWKELLQRCGEVFARLRSANLKAKPSKTLMGLEEVDYLGHVIQPGAIQPQEEKIKAIQECTRPTSKLSWTYRVLSQVCPGICSHFSSTVGSDKEFERTQVQLGSASGKCFSSAQGKSHVSSSSQNA